MMATAHALLRLPHLVARGHDAQQLLACCYLATVASTRTSIGSSS